MKIKELVGKGIKELKENNIEDASIIAKVLVSYVLKMDKIKIIIDGEEVVSKDLEIEYTNKINQIIKGYPLQYLIGKQEFMGFEFKVNENVLIPQPDTEILVEEVLFLINDKENVKILDMCTGSGCIGISLANILKTSKVTLCDISKQALKVAKENVKKYNLEDRVNILETNMFENVKEKYDIIVSNPPYIETNVINTLNKTVQKEPHLALDGGEDGLKFYKILINNMDKYLNENGYLCMEIGYNQKEKVENLVNGKMVYCKKDLSKNDRVIVIKK